MIRAAIALAWVAACTRTPIVPLSDVAPRSPPRATPHARAIAQLRALLEAPILDGATIVKVLAAPDDLFAVRYLPGECAVELRPLELALRELTPHLLGAPRSIRWHHIVHHHHLNLENVYEFMVGDRDVTVATPSRNRDDPVWRIVISCVFRRWLHRP